MSTITGATVDTAMRTVLRDLLAKIEVSAERVLTGVDPDDIHDLRVATRRTRTVLSQMPGVFDKSTAKVFKSGFRRIGAVTGKCRDLDVWLEALSKDQLSRCGGDPPGTHPLEYRIRQDRDAARLQAAKDLRDRWFHDLVDQWRTFIQTPDTGKFPPGASRAIAPVAALRILKAHRRILKHGYALPEAPSAAQFHRLRIDGKKLRYLLESFGGIFDAGRCQGLIENLKSLQDVLGGINDREVQLQALTALSQQNSTEITAINHHRRFLQGSLAAFNSDFTIEFQEFSSQNVTNSFQHLFGP